MTPAELPVPAGATCWGCGYRLQHLTVPRCPECGQPFNPARPNSMRLPGRGPMTMLMAVSPITVWFLASLAAAICIGMLQDVMTKWFWITPPAILCLGAMVGLVCRRRFRDWVLRDRPDAAFDADRRWTRRLMVLIAAAALYYSVGSYRCPHSTTYSFGPYRLVWTNDPTCRRLPWTRPHWISASWTWYDVREPTVATDFGGY